MMHQEQEEHVRLVVRVPRSLYDEAARRGYPLETWAVDFLRWGVRASFPLPVGTHVRRWSPSTNDAHDRLRRIGIVHRTPDPFPTPLPGALRGDEREVTWLDDGRTTIESIRDLEEVK